MHEFSLMAGLLKKIDRLAAEQNAERIVGVRVRLGALSHMSSEHFREHFVAGVRGTRADGARLEVVQSEDVDDPLAQEVILESIDVA